MENSIINKIALGTVQFGLNYGISNSHGKTSPEEVDEILTYCERNNIKTLDTASAYGDSEKILGKFNLQPFNVITKFLPEKECGKSLHEQFEDSLQNLNIKNVYGLLAHRTNDIIENEIQWKSLIELKASGKVKNIGFSFNEKEEADLVLKKGFIPDLIQAPYNYFDNRFDDIFKKLKDSFNVEIHTRSAFLQGLFFVDVGRLPSFFDPLKEEIQFLQNKFDDLPGHLLSYVLNKKEIDKVVIGVNTLNQLIENINAILRTESVLPQRAKQIKSELLMPMFWPK